MKIPRYFRALRLAIHFPSVAVASLFERRIRKSNTPPLYVFGFSSWKTFIEDWFPARHVIFVPTSVSSIEFNLYWRWRIRRDARSEVLTWQYKGPAELKRHCSKYKIPFYYVEDGFIRSVQLGARHTPPLSLTFDRRDMYFAADRPTGLEDLLSTYDFDGNPDVLKRAKSAIETMLQTGISKYNIGVPFDEDVLYGPKLTKRVLVIGQVEQDASIRYGCRKPFSDYDLVKLARLENPDADVFYKPHPEVLSGTAQASRDIREFEAYAKVIELNVSLADSFRSIDHVYTITSLAGFEALLRHIKVTTVGCPFYSGWGVTDDRQSTPRRKRKLSIEQIFAVAYIVYPRYFDPEAKAFIEIEDALSILAAMRAKAQQ